MSNSSGNLEGTFGPGSGEPPNPPEPRLDFREAALFLSELVPHATGDGLADDMQEVLRTILTRGDALEPRPANAWASFFRGALSNKRRERERRLRRIEHRLKELRELRRRRGLAPPADAELADATFAALLTLERDDLVCLLRADWLGQPLRQIAEEVFGDATPSGIAKVFRRVKRGRATMRCALGSLCPTGLRQAERVADQDRLGKCLAELSKALRL
jgi:hypothetical protein